MKGKGGILLKNNFRKSLATLASTMLLFSGVGPALATSPEKEASKNTTPYQVPYNVLTDAQQAFKQMLTKSDIKDNKLKKAAFKEEQVRVVVELTGKTPLEHATEKGVMYKDLDQKTKDNYEKESVTKQGTVKNALKSKGINMDYKLNFTTSFIGFSGLVNFKDIEKIEKTAGVKKVYLVNEYNRPEPEMSTSHDYIQSRQTWGDAKYKGEGMVVAVIDSGVDPAHKDFVLSKETDESLTKDKTESIIQENQLKGKYYTEKVPYGYNYYDLNDTILDLGPSASEHGMHVAGTVAANGDEKDGGLKGVAPEAQVLGMKVFSNDPKFPSTYSDVYLAAIDDSIKLGADVLNMSLGSTASFYEEESPEDLAITRAVKMELFHLFLLETQVTSAMDMLTLYMKILIMEW